MIMVCLRELTYCFFMIFVVGSSAYGDQILLQFIVQRQPQITLENLKEVRGDFIRNFPETEKGKGLKPP